MTPPVDLAKPVKLAAVWAAPGIPVTIAGITFECGYVYVGSADAAAPELRGEPSLIDPDLPVVLGPMADRLSLSGQGLSYRAWSPEERGAYLLWLATGRRTGAGLNAAWLYFYGLERRLVGTMGQLAEEERLALYDELTQLAGEYEPLSTAVQALLDVAGPGRDNGNPPERLNNVAFRKGLGRMAQRQDPIPADWALAWLSTREEFIRRTPAVRCEAEFRQLFCLRYLAEFGPGLCVKPNKTRIKTTYCAQNPSMPDAVRLEWDLPDIVNLKQPVSLLLRLAEVAQDELDAYSRFAGRRPDDLDSLEAISLLPTELFRDRARIFLSPLEHILEQRLASGEDAAFTYQQLRSAVTQLPENPDKRAAVSLANCLQQIDVGLEPDVRFGAIGLDVQKPLVLFRQRGGPSAPSAAYTNAASLLYLGVVLAKADGMISAQEQSLLEQQVDLFPDLTPEETRRLQAHLQWLLLVLPNFAGLKKRIEGLTPHVREEFGRFLLRIANADGVIAKEEVSQISKLYGWLELDTSKIYDDLHHAAAEPVEVGVAGDSAAVTYRLPPPPRAPASAEKPLVDLEKVTRIHAETERVAMLMQRIFAEEEPAPTPQPAIDVPALRHGLDAAHTRLLLSLIGRAEWFRDEVRAAAIEVNLLPDGALDRLNEMALEAVGELLLEGDDPMTVNEYAREALKL